MNVEDNIDAEENMDAHESNFATVGEHLADQSIMIVADALHMPTDIVEEMTPIDLLMALRVSCKKIDHTFKRVMAMREPIRLTETDAAIDSHRSDEFGEFTKDELLDVLVARRMRCVQALARVEWLMLEPDHQHFTTLADSDTPVLSRG